MIASTAALQESGVTQPPKTILVVDDERNIRRTLQMVLEGEGYSTLAAESAEDALSILTNPRIPVDLAIFDIRLPGISGLEALERITNDEALRDMPVIVLSGHATVAEAASAIKLGASDFFEKPFVRERVVVSVRNALEAATAKRALREVTRASAERYEMIGTSAAMQKVFRDIERVAPTKASVLIAGESGTGKELVSRAIHALSPRRDGPFVKVNCAAIPKELIESVLFGHEKGAFTGAQTKKRGLFEQAHGGTLFLDEIGDMDLMAQAKVLRALQSGEVSRVGSEHVMHLDVRVLAATNKDLTREVQRGTFREDLYFRLNVFPIRSPALRERLEDVPILVTTFMAAFARENGTRVKPVDEDVVARLCERRWPGNVRELKNVVERMAIVAEDRVTVADLPEDPYENPFADDASDPGDPHGSAPPPDESGAGDDDDVVLGAEGDDAVNVLPAGDEGRTLTLREFRDRAERQYILDTLRASGWNITRTAVLLGVERTNLHRKIRGYGIVREDARKSTT